MHLQKDFTTDLMNLNRVFGTDIGIISEIVGQNYVVTQTASEMTILSPKDRFVTEDTYCNEVLKQEGTVTYNEVGKIKSMVLHPVYTAMQLEAYIGTPLIAQGRVVGTLNFSGFSPKVPAFNNDDKKRIETLAREVECAIML